MQRKYKIGEIHEYCQEYLNCLNDLMKILTPLAVRASLLMTLSIKINSVFKNYDFSVSFIEQILINITGIVKTEIEVSNFINDFKFPLIIKL